MMLRKQAGFTLIELMIVVAIIGILAAIAFPSYQESTAKTRRANAQAEMLSLSSALERYYSENNHYSNAADAGADIGAPAGTVYRVETKVATFYNITISKTDDSDVDGAGNPVDTVAAQSYELSAVPVTGSAMAGDRCGTMTLSSRGVKTPTDCWR